MKALPMHPFTTMRSEPDIREHTFSLRKDSGMKEETNKSLWPGWKTVRLIGRGSFGAVYEIERDMLDEKKPR